MISDKWLKLLLIFFILPLTLQSQEDLYSSLRSNVVSIESFFKEQGEERGFGLICGHTADNLFVVTAAHVVDKDGIQASSIQLRFYQNPERVKAHLISKMIDDDIALLSISRPEGFQYRFDCLGLEPKKNQEAIFIGRDGDWYIPAKQVRGSIFGFQGHEIKVDISSVREGSSGAPLLTPEGVVGIVFQTETSRAYALKINRVEELVTENGRFPQHFQLILRRDNPRSDLEAWRKAKTTHTIHAYEYYIQSFPNGEFAFHARDSLQQLKKAEEEKLEEIHWQSTTEKNTIEAYQQFLFAHPQGKYFQEAKNQIAKLSRPVFPETLAFLEGGEFEMGNPAVESDREYQVHLVSLQNYLMGKFEVTFEEYDIFCKVSGRKKPDDEGLGRGALPVFNINWYDAAAFCNWKSKQEGLDTCYVFRGKTAITDFQANGYRLPTEAEWEYAARGGILNQYSTYSGSDRLDEVGWYGANSTLRPQPVGRKKPNNLGIFDLSGNLAEWCNDWYSDQYYPRSGKLMPAGPDRGNYKTVRGGSWDSLDRQCTVYKRGVLDPESQNKKVGFRYVRKME